ncbi:DUF397 domain-containing protein [Streptomyces mutabilis]|uniref:DUF397 domain-containing protein n=2 Tax=Streptomyces TaxID=1883 RepID=UPI002796265D|nr:MULTISPECIES: DUF397 domain-containing protein [unclassified Streptomyces]
MPCHSRRRWLCSQRQQGATKAMTDRTIRNAATLTGWRKSSHSNDQGGSCLEVVDSHPGGIPVRDSKAPTGPALVFSAAGWRSFIRTLKEAPPPSKA